MPPHADVLSTQWASSTRSADSTRWASGRGPAISRVQVILRDYAVALCLFGLLLAGIGWTAMPQLPAIPAAPTHIDAGFSARQSEPTSGFAVQAGFRVSESTARASPLTHFGQDTFLQLSNRGVMVAILASVFAAIIAFNLWFLRHLGRVYASARSGGGRRGRG